MGFSSRPSNYAFLMALREPKKRPVLKPCEYLKPTTKLRSYQAVSVIHFISLLRMILGDCVGSGKTLTGIGSYAYLLASDPSLKMLIVTPKSAVDQWAEEFDKFSTGIRVHVLRNTYGKLSDGSGYGCEEDLKKTGKKFKILRGLEARKAQYESVDAHVLIVNYYSVKKDYRFLVENRGPKFVFLMDEIQEIKSERSQNHFGAEFISNSATRVYGMSATLIKNRLEEAYQIYNVVVPGLFPGKNKFLKEFTERKKLAVFNKKTRRKRYFNKIVGYKNLDKFREIIEPYFLIRRSQDIADELPKLTSRKIVLEMSAEQQSLYKKALNGDLYRSIIKSKYFEFEAYMASNPSPTDKELDLQQKLKAKYEESLTEMGLVKNKLAALSYCQLVSNGPGWIREEGESSKETEFRRLFEYELGGEKVIIFTRFKSGIPRLEKILDDLDIKHTKITGDESREDRTKNRWSFQDDNSGVDVIFITQAGSAAINLQKARIILFYDTPWSYGDLYQTIGRAQRIGSVHEHIVLLHMVNKKSIDEHVLSILETKKDLISKVMGDIAEGAIDFKEDQISLKDDEGSVDALFSEVFGRKAA